MRKTERHRPLLMRLPLPSLVPHPLNANVMSSTLREKLKTHIQASGRYPPLIVRRLADGTFQLLDGHQRWQVLLELGEEYGWCLIWDVTDEEALILLATLNRLEGEDVPGRRAALIAELEAHHTLAELARLLPEDEAQLESTLRLLDMDVDGLLQRLTAEAGRAAASGPQLFSFAVEPEDAPAVEEAIARAVANLSGTNRRGQALVLLAQKYLEGS
jgi:ParB-like chromosome segregation protein Spo0J